uniref:Tr-type G domain-containing protein n=1 Tax=Chromera velia CCMP2878 TaxID=1169474 RepID=A0A0G4I7C9_9ALVE|eukprot:Cvel_11651.t1-p1 / transcript=Cvel_11651.t1 / gene=Cvel_11651 / organism=Chromera_velia_CCMP2878 / gene_product=hypothetical protein / transcript_product=hypothetical protein / location=Cvel_scaffold738:51596-54477(+) / protein_length=874 / sequence_SO=supercontig / SO=protein_coding / is_pseudo=false
MTLPEKVAALLVEADGFPDPLPSSKRLPRVRAFTPEVAHFAICRSGFLTQKELASIARSIKDPFFFDLPSGVHKYLHAVTSSARTTLKPQRVRRLPEETGRSTVSFRQRKVVFAGPQGHGKTHLVSRLIFALDDIPSSEIKNLLDVAELNGKLVRSEGLSWTLDNLLLERKAGKTEKFSWWPVVWPTSDPLSPVADSLVSLVDTPGSQIPLRNRLRPLLLPPTVAAAAVLVVSANPEQHTEIVRLQIQETLASLLIAGGLPVSQLIVALSHMDVVGWSLKAFEQAKDFVCSILRDLSGSWQSVDIDTDAVCGLAEVPVFVGVSCFDGLRGLRSVCEEVGGEGEGQNALGTTHSSLLQALHSVFVLDRQRQRERDERYCLVLSNPSTLWVATDRAFDTKESMQIAPSAPNTAKPSASAASSSSSASPPPVGSSSSPPPTTKQSHAAGCPPHAQIEAAKADPGVKDEANKSETKPSLYPSLTAPPSSFAPPPFTRRHTSCEACLAKRVEERERREAEAATTQLGRLAQGRRHSSSSSSSPAAAAAAAVVVMGARRGANPPTRPPRSSPSLQAFTSGLRAAARRIISKPWSLKEKVEALVPTFEEVVKEDPVVLLSGVIVRGQVSRGMSVRLLFPSVPSLGHSLSADVLSIFSLKVPVPEGEAASEGQHVSLCLRIKGGVEKEQLRKAKPLPAGTVAIPEGEYQDIGRWLGASEETPFRRPCSHPVTGVRVRVFPFKGAWSCSAEAAAFPAFVEDSSQFLLFAHYFGGMVVSVEKGKKKEKEDKKEGAAESGDGNRDKWVCLDLKFERPTLWMESETEKGATRIAGLHEGSGGEQAKGKGGWRLSGVVLADNSARAVVAVGQVVDVRLANDVITQGK